MVDQMPAFPNSVSRIIQLTSDINCSPKALVQVIDHDPVMTMKILKLVNSSYFGLSCKVISINQSLVLVGINTIKNLALAISTVGVLPKENHAGLNMKKFLLHSLGTATIAKLLSQRFGVSSKDAGDYFATGLLHDFGKIVFALFMPKEFESAMQMAENDNIPLHQAELIIIGVDHAQIGGILGEKWQLPTDLVTCIREHHTGISNNDNVTKMCDCIMAANQIIKMKNVGDAGSSKVEELPEPTIKRLGADLNSLMESLGDISEALDKMRVFT